MWYVLFFLLPFGGLELLAPVFLWILCDPCWTCAFIVVVLWSRGVLRELAEHRPNQPAATLGNFPRLSALRSDSGAAHSALITPVPRTSATQNSVSHLRFRDLNRLEKAVWINSQIIQFEQ